VTAGNTSTPDDDQSDEENGEDTSEDEDDESVKQPRLTAEERAQELERIVSNELRSYKHHGQTQEEASSESSEEDEDDEEESDEDDEEPALKYERMGGDAQTVLSKKDSASAITIANKRMVSPLRWRQCRQTEHVQALGTHMGIVHVMDLSGNTIKMFRPHSASILDICMDATADWVGTASMDGLSPFCPPYGLCLTTSQDRSSSTRYSPLSLMGST
jgi:vacuolar protein sorting-associated protein 41